MSSLNFPSNPYTGQLFTLGNQTYRWSGSAWLRYSTDNTTVGSVTATNTITIGTGTQVVVINTSSIYINNNLVITTSTLLNLIQPGTGISVTTASGYTVVSSIANLQNVTDNGYTTTNRVVILNTAQLLSNTEAFECFVCFSRSILIILKPLGLIRLKST